MSEDERPTGLEAYGIVAMQADRHEFQGILVSCQVGLADPTTVMLLNHIAWMQERWEQR